jgi:hypothetical protein
MPQQKNKGQAGMGGRGKNQKKGRQDQATRTKERKPGGGATRSRPALTARGNQKRNQKEWHEESRMESRY